MNYKVTLKHPEREDAVFTCEDDTLIYKAARAAGYIVHTACERGGCGACRSHLLKGKLHYARKISKKWRIEPETGKVVFDQICSSTPRSDVTLEMVHAWDPMGVPSLQKLTG
jgi:ferredoxin